MKYLFYGLTFSLFVLSANAQKPQDPGPRSNERVYHQRFRNGNDQPNRAGIEMFKIKFITEQLALTPQEAEAFWPIYNEHKNSMRAIYKDKKDNELEMQEATLAAGKKMAAALKPILKTDIRVNDAVKIDKEFMKKVRNEMTRRRGGPPPRRS